LRDRYRKASAGSPAAGIVRAKTGTLSGVDAIAGITVDADGRALVFAFLAYGSPDPTVVPSPTQEALDRLTAGLASCGCR
jgi:D-alanyl-D-alanine carboxypeptidase/D-alanyl-D-alanine-endopeptidase (penicillin-binding protein 4)